MAIYWIDGINGDDDTGDGSQANPWGTVKKAAYGAAAAVLPGDEIRIAKSPDPTVLNGTLAWVDDSKYIITSEDLTGVLAAKDFIGKGSTGEIWWEISAITATKITLINKYDGTSEIMASQKLGTIDLSSGHAVEVYQKSGTEENPIEISGGWDLSSGEQTGMSYFRHTGNLNYGIYLNANSSYINLENIGLLRCGHGLRLYGVTAPNCSFKNIDVIGCTVGTFLDSENCSIEDCVFIGNSTASSNGINATRQGHTLKNLKIMFFQKYNSSSSSVEAAITSMLNSTIENCTIKKCLYGIRKCNNSIIKNCTISKSAGGNNSHYGIYRCYNSTFENCTIENLTGSYSYGVSYCNDLILNNCTIQNFNSSTSSYGIYQCNRLDIKNSNIRYSGTGSGSETYFIKNSIFTNYTFETDTKIFSSPSNLKLFKCTFIGTIGTFTASGYPDNVPFITSHRENDIPYNHRNFLKYGETGCHSAFAHLGEACVRLSPINADNPVKINAIIKYISSTASDIEVDVFAKRESDFNGTLKLKASVLGDTIETITPAFINSEMETIPDPLPPDYNGDTPTFTEFSSNRIDCFTAVSVKHWNSFVSCVFEKTS